MRATLFILWMLVTYSVSAQTGWSRQDKRDFDDADFAYYQEDYAFAFELLDPIFAKDSTYAPLNLRYAVCLIELGKDRDQARNLLAEAVEAGEVEALFHYARALHLHSEFDKALEYFTRYNQNTRKEMTPAQVERQVAMVKRARKMVAVPVDVEVYNAGPGVNTEWPEYVPLITADNETLYFTSRRPGSTAGLKDPNGAWFEDIYVSQKEDGEWLQASNVGQPINTETHDATVSISADGNTMIIYRTNRNLTGGDLYISENKRGSWTKPSKLDKRINSEYQEASASISSDGSTLYFSSNRPGGFGGKDLYRVKRLPNGEWSLPKNMGPNINTPFDEDAPFIDIDNNNLYFASNGHETMGGYDLFRSEDMGGEIWTTPENLGYPVNTVEDDIYLSIDAGGKRGYYSSTKSNGFGGLDVYHVEFIYRQNKNMVVKGEVINASGEAIKASITVIDEFTNEIQGVYNTNESTGKYIFVLHPLTPYRAIIEAEGYKSQDDELYFGIRDEDDFEIDLTPFILSNDKP
jgi:hypothetical protein